jgi:predicted RNA methylase
MEPLKDRPMKTRESGMPEEELWSTFFTPEEVLARLGLTNRCRDAVDFGCGYGTFTIPAARVVRGMVYALDIEPEMVAATATKAKVAGVVVRDSPIHLCRNERVSGL